MTRVLYKNSDLKVLSRIIKNSCAENSLNACKACAVYENLVKNLTSWNKEYNPLIKNVWRLLRKNLGSFMRVSTVFATRCHT